MHTNEITERIKISDRGIRINELLSIRKEIRGQLDECWAKLRAYNAELSRLLPVKIDIASCESCGGNLSFADVIEDADGMKAVMFCKECKPNG